MTKKLSWILLLVLSALGTAAFAAEREARWEAMARRAAEESIALLKNEGATLPLAEGATVSLFGAEKLLVCGGGSSAVSSPRTPSMEESLAAAGLSLVGRGAARYPNICNVPEEAALAIALWGEGDGSLEFREGGIDGRLLATTTVRKGCPGYFRKQTVKLLDVPKVLDLWIVAKGGAFHVDWFEFTKRGKDEN